jgi:hypothetical protein
MFDLVVLLGLQRQWLHLKRTVGYQVTQLVQSVLLGSSSRHLECIMLITYSVWGFPSLGFLSLYLPTCTYASTYLSL